MLLPFPPLTVPPPPNATLLLINAGTLSDGEYTSFRDRDARNNGFPLVYPSQDELRILLPQLLSWIGSWVPVLESDPSVETKEEFASTIISKVVQLHPFLFANKRTGRELANLVRARFNLSLRVWDFDAKNVRRYRYQWRFLEYLILRDYKSLHSLHEGTQKTPIKINITDRSHYQKLYNRCFTSRDITE